MSNLRKAAEAVVAHWQSREGLRVSYEAQSALIALEAALAEPVQEPVAWIHGDEYGDACHWVGGRMPPAGTKLYAALAEQELVHQFRKQYCANWYDGHPDHTDGGGPYEERTLYLAPPWRQTPTDDASLFGKLGRVMWEMTTTVHSPGISFSEQLELIPTIWSELAKSHRAQRPLLTDEEIEMMWEADTTSAEDCQSLYYFKVVARAVERKIGEKE